MPACRPSGPISSSPFVRPAELLLLLSLATSACGPSPDADTSGETKEEEAAAGPPPAERCDELASALGSSGTASGEVCYLGIGPADSLARSLARALDRAPSARGGRREGAEGPPPASRTGRAGIVAGTPCDTLARTLATDPADAASGPGYCKVIRPRDDLDMSVDGIPVSPSLGVGSWFAFRQTASGDSAVVTGDMALTQDRVNPAIAALRNAGIEIVSLHNHMLFDDPRVMFFHFQARGAPKTLAEGLRSGLEAAGLAGGP